MKNLPALNVVVTGLVIQHNFDEFEVEATKFLSSIKRDLLTDDDFAEAKENVKNLKSFEDTLTEIKERIISESAEMASLIAHIDKFIFDGSNGRLQLSKLVKNRESIIKDELVVEHVNIVNSYLEAANNSVTPVKLHPKAINADFDDAIKGKKTIAGLKKGLKERSDGLIKEIKNKLEIVTENIEFYELEHNQEYSFLFHDINELLLQMPTLFKMSLENRVNSYKFQKQLDDKKKADADELARLEAEKLELELANAKLNGIDESQVEGSEIDLRENAVIEESFKKIDEVLIPKSVSIPPPKPAPYPINQNEVIGKTGGEIWGPGVINPNREGLGNLKKPDHFSKVVLNEHILAEIGFWYKLVMELDRFKNSLVVQLFDSSLDCNQYFDLQDGHYLKYGDDKNLSIVKKDSI